MPQAACWFTAFRSSVCPRRSFASEIEGLKKMGVEDPNQYGDRQDRLPSTSCMRNRAYEAVFIGTGAGLPNFMNIPGENLQGRLFRQ